MNLKNLSTNIIDCVLCGSNVHKLLWIKNDFRYVQCGNCKLVFINPQLTIDSVKKIYQVGFTSKYAAKPTRLNIKPYVEVLKWAEKFRKTGRMLDVGCFTGNFLLAARSAGWEIYGTEISSDAAAVAEKVTGAKVYVGDLKDIQLEPSSFDFISLFDVIEHVHDPVRSLEECVKALRPGGGLYLNTPNFSSLTRLALGKKWSVFFPWHLFYFNTNTIRRTVEKAGLRVQNMYASGFAPVSAYDPMLALQSSNQIAKPKSSVIKKMRKINMAATIFWSVKKLEKVIWKILSQSGLYIGSTIYIIAVNNEETDK